MSGYAAQDAIRHYVHDTIANFACNMIMQDRKDNALIINGHLTGHINDSLNRLDAQVTIIDSLRVQVWVLQTCLLALNLSALTLCDRMPS